MRAQHLLNLRDRPLGVGDGDIGGAVGPNELIERVIGGPLSVAPYLRQRVGEIYRI